ncbi:uncharacterized protein RJT21DRAFT_13333 [Scheffersomyces amazonensis]|uniref:uncharacterized protein n=1 Tax=Scheffersomyces amazonensis TaxID=1078765 RepID=UPI00315C8273
MCYCLSDCILIILSILFPPLPVWIRRGICSADSFINILLSILGYLPGLIHSWYIIAKYPPYHQGTKVYYVYRNDIEAQVPRDQHVHHHHHCDASQETPIRSQPGSIQTPAANYGAISEGSSSNANGTNAPPAYTEFDNKTQH